MERVSRHTTAFVLWAWAGGALSGPLSAQELLPDLTTRLQEQPSVSLDQAKELAARYDEDPDVVLEAYGTLLYRNKLDDEAFEFVLDEAWAVRQGNRSPPTFDKFVEDAFYSAAGSVVNGGDPGRIERWTARLAGGADAEARRELTDLRAEMNACIKAHGVIREMFARVDEQGALTPEQIEAFEKECDADKPYPRTTRMLRDMYASSLYDTYKRHHDDESMRELIRQKLLNLGQEPDLMSRSRSDFRRALLGCARVQDPEVADLLAQELEYEQRLLDLNPGYQWQDDYEAYLARRDRNLGRLEQGVEAIARGERAFREAQQIHKLARRGALTADDVERVLSAAGEDFGRPIANQLVADAVADCFQRISADPGTSFEARDMIHEWALAHAPASSRQPVPVLVVTSRGTEDLANALEALARDLRKVAGHTRAEDSASSESRRRQRSTSLPTKEEIEALARLYGLDVGDAKLNDLLYRSIIAGLADALNATLRADRFGSESSTGAEQAREVQAVLARWCAQVTRDPPALLRFSPSPYEAIAAQRPSELLAAFLRDQAEQVQERRPRDAIRRALRVIEQHPAPGKTRFRVGTLSRKDAVVLTATESDSD